MTNDLPVSGVVPVSQMFGEDDEETVLLRVMAEQARDFLSEFKWCGSISEMYFGAGVGNVFAVFFAHISPSQPNVDEWLWVVVGDLPPAYLVIDECQTPKQALSGYIYEMRRWVAAARKGQSSPDIIPVNCPATPEWAEVLNTRLDTLENKIIPVWFVT